MRPIWSGERLQPTHAGQHDGTALRRRRFNLTHHATAVLPADTALTARALGPLITAPVRGIVRAQTGLGAGKTGPSRHL